MRLLVEVVIFAAIIALGWERSFHQSLGDVPVIGSYFAHPKTMPGTAAPKAMAGQPLGPAQSVASLHESSLLDPNHRTVLDKPIDPKNKTFTGHIFYKDEAGKSYWLDAQGQRHYE